MGVVIERSEVVGGVVINRRVNPHPRYSDAAVKRKAKRNCRRCHGRGRLPFDNPRTGVQWVETCSCVHRRD